MLSQRAARRCANPIATMKECRAMREERVQLVKDALYLLPKA
jgi:hypothetical protein